MIEDSSYQFHSGSAPLLVSVPHDGRVIPATIAARMTPRALDLPDTDWHVARLYDFCNELGASMLVARLSRYVVDLNRPQDDASLYPGQATTGLCPTITFDAEPLYRQGAEPDACEIRERVSSYWRPYHDRISSWLAATVGQHGYALLWDAHSIASEVPMLFDGRLPVLNIGTNGGASCAVALQEAISTVAAASPCSAVVNGRFRGGYITRHYGDPPSGRHAVQLELAQRAYMDEPSRRYDADRAAVLRDTLRSLLGTYLDTAARLAHC